MKLGVLVGFTDKGEEEIKKVHDLGFESCQLSAWNDSLYTDEYAKIINEATKKYNVTVSTFWCG